MINDCLLYVFKCLNYIFNVSIITCSDAAIERVARAAKPFFMLSSLVRPTDAHHDQHGLLHEQQHLLDDLDHVHHYHHDPQREHEIIHQLKHVQDDLMHIQHHHTPYGYHSHGHYGHGHYGQYH